MVRIGDLVRLDEQAEFRSDVQLSAYENRARNVALLRSYMFGSAAKQNDHSATPSRSPVDILNLLVEAFSSERLDNRFVVVANYGHGKSHLALALANYFGRPVQSTELNILFTKLENAVGNGPGANRYRAFKEGRGQFLVIRLRGDVRRKLREQFVMGLEAALREHDETRDAHLPFWFNDAARFLKKLDGDQLTEADKFLESYRTQVSILLQDVNNRDESAHEKCVALAHHLHGVKPHFGGDIALKEVMGWTVKNFCGEGKPFGGVLVLFDEFSLYVQAYATQGAPGELQDLLNGIDDHRGNAAFLAFAQHDPIRAARDLYKLGSANTQQESLERELTRLQKKYLLYSVLESVIDAYLVQSDDTWRRFLEEPRVQGSLVRATDKTLSVFYKRYEVELHWGTEQVQEIVAKGCFPLHPLTTALLCNLNLQAGSAQSGVARTVLGFVNEELKRRERLQAAKEDLDLFINWVMPIELVEYYGEHLSHDHYQQYERALNALSDEATYEQEAVLSALLLQEAAKLTSKGRQQIELLSELSGIAYDKVGPTLRELSDMKAILYIEYQKQYTFWSLGNDPHKLDNVLTRHLEDKQVDWPLLSATGHAHLSPVRVKIDWGHTQDWEAGAYMLTRGEFTKERIRNLIPPYKVGNRAIIEGERGVVIWLLASNQDDLQWFRDQAAQVLDNALRQDEPAPIVAIIPDRPTPNLFVAMLRLYALEQMTQEERKDVGLELHTNETERARKAISDEFVQLKIGTKWEQVTRANHKYLVPLAYRNTVRALNAASHKRVLRACYMMAYRAAPPEFLTQYKLNSTHLKAAVKHLANLLRQNLVIERQNLPQGMARDLAEKILQRSWAILDSRGQIQKPGNARTKRAWDFLDETFVAGKETQVREAIIPLLNPPFGYDYHTATLLFCAWFGYHQHDLELTVDGQRAANTEPFDNWLSKDSKDFVNRICVINNVGLGRRNRALIEKEAHDYLERARQSLSQEEAERISSWLIEYGKEDSNNKVVLHEQAGKAGEQLRGALAAAQAYDNVANEILEQLEAQHTGLTNLIGLQNKISKLPEVGNVKVTGQDAEALRKAWLRRVDGAVEQECLALENLTDLQRAALNREKLSAMKAQLKRAGLAGAHLERVDKAQEVIEQRVEALKAYEGEAGIRGAIQAMTRETTLETLYAYRQQLREMQDLTPATETLRNEKLSQINDEISTLEEIGETLCEEAPRISSLQDLRKWENVYLGTIARFEGTSRYESLKAVHDDSEGLREYLDTIEALEKAPATNQSEAKRIQARLADLRLRTRDHEGKIAAFDRAHAAFEQKVRRQAKESAQWLLSLEEQWYNDASPLEIKREIENAFGKVMRSDDRERLEQLRRQVVEQIERDIITKLESDFRKIADDALRQECLERLTKVHAEIGSKVI